MKMRTYIYLFIILLFLISSLLAINLPFFLSLSGPDSLIRQINRVTITVRWNGHDQSGLYHYYDDQMLIPKDIKLWETSLPLPENGTVHYFYVFHTRDQNEIESPLLGAKIGADAIFDTVDVQNLHPETATGDFSRPPYLSFQNDPATTITISWATETAGNSVVEFGLDSTYGNIVEDSQLKKHHSIELTNLTPNTLYHYRVRTDGIYTSPDHTFRTAPGDPSTPFTLALYGDSRTNDEARRRVKNTINSIHPWLAISTGDLVKDGKKRNLWKIWFSTMHDMLDHIPFLSSIGNHEDDSDIYYELFHYPTHPNGGDRAEAYYSFNYGSVHFIVLNSEDVGGTGNAQRDWLEADLQQADSNPAIRWKIVVFHRPAYSSGSHGGNSQIVQHWAPLFEQYHVDLVFAGHDHDYERTNVINNVIYIVTGGGGAPLRSVGSSSWTAYSLSVYHVCKLQITENTLYFEAIDTTGNIFDSFNINITPSQLKYVAFQPQGYRLLQNYPNPFNGTTMFTYQIGRPCPVVTLTIYDLLGKVVWQKQFFNQPAGTYIVNWDGRDMNGRALSSGIYMYELRANNFRQFKKLMLIQ